MSLRCQAAVAASECICFKPRTTAFIDVVAICCLGCNIAVVAAVAFNAIKYCQGMTLIC